MSTPQAGIPEADWLLWPPEARQFILAQQQEIEQLRSQLAALAIELASLREQIGRSSLNSSKPPSSDGPGFKPPARRKGSGRQRGGQPGHPGSGPELPPIERVDEVVEHHPESCRRCGTLLQGEDPVPVRHQVIEIPPITPLVIEHRLHRLVCTCCSTSTCATLPADVEASRYGPRLSGLVGLMGSAFPLSFSKTQALLDQLLGVEISRGAIATIRQRLSAALEQSMKEALAFARQQPVANNPTGKRGWQWVMVTAALEGVCGEAGGGAMCDRLPRSDVSEIDDKYKQARLALESVNPEGADASFGEAAESAKARARAAEQLQAKAKEVRQSGLKEAAEATAQRGQLAMARLRYLDSARYFAEAADLLPASMEARSLAYRQQQALALYRYGDEEEDNGILLQAVKIYKSLV